MELGAAQKERRAEVTRREREKERLLQAIMDGVPASQVKGKLDEVSARIESLTTELHTADEAPVLLHPRMGKYYREQIGLLVDALQDEKRPLESIDAIR
jgi:hypothetical protein